MTGYFENERPDVAAMVPLGEHLVLDAGCGAGRLGETLVATGKAYEVDGIERNPAAAAQASTRLDRVDEIDLESGQLLRELASERASRYDLLIVADVLEHLRDPWGVLEQLVQTVKPGGLVIASIPNVRTVSVVLPLLLRGRFEYREQGVLDSTHLRFFTRDSSRALLEGAGLSIVEIRRSSAHWRRGWKAWLGDHIGDFGNEQFLISARRLAS